MKNKYLNHSRISEYQFRRILRFFRKDYTAFSVSDATGISRVTINNLYAKFRERIILITDKRLFDHEVEVDESYFGARRVRGKEEEEREAKLRLWDF